MDKKAGVLLLTISLLWGSNYLKDNRFFLGIDGGGTRIESSKTGMIELKWGYDYYISNPLQFSNRIYLSVMRLAGVDRDIHGAELHYDFVFNNHTIARPYVGFLMGYASRYRNGSGADKDFFTYGGELGVLFYLGDHWELEVGGAVNNGSSGGDWKESLKRYFIGFNYTF
ncbi:MAG: hypothetical protein C6I01_02095 [Epsilonproteobacteria bacterium]|jgi:hypothetical protein|nr:hypothetical protein [Campylobacterota bacterium]NPA89375.1 hypothetical protein [Campylobacterota bacterium]